MAKKVKVKEPKVGITPAAATVWKCALWLAEDSQFPGLRRECSAEGPMEDCAFCAGRGWVPVVDLETLMEATRKASCGINIITLGSLHSPGIYYRAWCGGCAGDGKTATLAAYRAVVLRMMDSP